MEIFGYFLFTYLLPYVRAMLLRQYILVFWTNLKGMNTIYQTMKGAMTDQTIQVFLEVFKRDSLVRFTEQMLAIIAVKTATPCLNAVPHLVRMHLHKFRQILLVPLQHICKVKIVHVFHIVSLCVPEDDKRVVVIVI